MLNLGKGVMATTHAGGGFACSNHHTDATDCFLHLSISLPFLLASFPVVLQTESGAREEQDGSYASHGGVEI